MAAGCCCLTLSLSFQLRLTYWLPFFMPRYVCVYTSVRVPVYVFARARPPSLQHAHTVTSTNTHSHGNIYGTEYIRLKNSTSDKGNKSSLMLYLLPYRIIWRVFFFSSLLSAQSLVCFGCSRSLFCFLCYRSRTFATLAYSHPHFCFDSFILFLLLLPIP